MQFPRNHTVLFAFSSLLFLFAIAMAQLLAPPMLSIELVKFNRNGTEATMLVACVLIAVWAFSANLRCTDRKIARYLTIISALLIIWMAIVLLKYALNSPWMESICWYLYYVPLLGTPMLTFFASLRASGSENTRWASGLKKVAAGISAALIAAVLTNNLHHAVFEFSFENPAWRSDYSYGPGYWAIVVWAVILCVLFLGVIFRGARKELHKTVALALSLIGIVVIYGILYVTRFEPVFSHNMSLRYSIAFILILELFLDLGLFPSNIRQGRVFASLPFDIWLLSKSGEEAYRTDQAPALSANEREQILEMTPSNSKKAAAPFSEHPGKTLSVYRVPGGIAAVAEDVSDIEQQREDLAQRHAYLEQQNATLASSKNVQSLLLSQQHEQRLIQEVESLLSSTMDEVAELIATLPNGEDEKSIQERTTKLMLAKVLIAYCKRKGALLFEDKSNPEYGRSRLQLIMNETASDLRTVGIDCAAIVDLETPLSREGFSIIYECFYDFIRMAFLAMSPALLFFVKEKALGYAEMSVMLEYEQADTELFAKCAELRSKLENSSLKFSLVENDDAIHLSMAVPSKEEGR